MLRALLLLAFLLLPATVKAQSVSPADGAEFQRIITAQIEAFRADDGPAAYAHAAPLIRQLFPTPDVFMAMVKNGYKPVYRPQSYRFGESAIAANGRQMQRVSLVGPDGKAYEAVYSFERQPDGSWKISGCYLEELPGLDT